MINTDLFIARDRCPVCASGDGKQLFSSPLTEPPVRSLLQSHHDPQGTVDWSLLEGTDYRLLECGVCGLIWQWAAPNDRMMSEIYDRMIDPAFLEKVEHERLTLASFQQIANELAMLFSRLGKHPGDITLLDFGSGHGRWARVARGMGARVFTTEIGEAKREMARSIGAEVIADAEVDTMRFDIVHTEQVFEHVADPGDLFRRLSRVTAGLMKLAVPPGDTVAAALARHPFPTVSPFEKVLAGKRLTPLDYSWNAVQPLEHINCFPRSAIARLADDHGMEIIGERRRRNLSVDLSNPASFLRSAAGAVRSLGKNLLREKGYYVLRPSKG
ncbi:class I SAM-dependent methyltransferase [Stakelama tenebrarum]|uniref:Class I SAM-dependent methyltransferase n=1 Tax=Stakelama tenebrarum TaxID=2711215 RepID=A0A6G6Y3V6_9SPHN|nr:class I SAM-dependent methyltransferase [Sphingosinithalassobacter tenebrarum]QIG79531.1 class I SAM-dependent methyltransferase [Sphingosinithalassobacter tenebrarum]